jgi:hypothetical protein
VLEERGGPMTLKEARKLPVGAVVQESGIWKFYVHTRTKDLIALIQMDRANGRPDPRVLPFKNTIWPVENDDTGNTELMTLVAATQWKRYRRIA